MRHRLQFILGILLLFFACAVQFWLLSSHVFINAILATLIAFAFFFDIWELLVFILFSIFVINWQPAISLEIILFGLIPIGAYAFHHIVGWKLWAAVPAAVIAGFLVLYLAVAPGLLLSDASGFLIDIIVSVVFAGAISLALERTK